MNQLTMVAKLSLCGGLAFLVVATTVFPASPAAADLTGARRDFSAFCAKCHGASGHGDGPVAPTLDIKPRDFTDCARMDKVSDETLFTAISGGGAAAGVSHDMAAWGQGLNEDQIRDLVDFVRSFCKQ